MSISITYTEFHNNHDSRNSNTNEYAGFSATRNVSAQILITDKDKKLIPCSYQDWVVAHDHGVGSGVFFVPSGEGAAINSKTFEKIEKVTIESSNYGPDGSVVGLMKNPPKDVQFIMFDETKEEILPQEYWEIPLLDIRFRKRKKVVYKHSFFLCRLKEPYKSERASRLAEEKRLEAEWRASLDRFEKELSHPSLITEEEKKDFVFVNIEHTEEKQINSGGSLPPIDKLVSLAKINFIKKTPVKTVRIFAQKETREIPSTFLSDGKQSVTYSGYALVPKQK